MNIARLFAAALLALAACVGPADSETIDMTTPGPIPGTVYVSSADAGPGAPFSQILCPDDGAQVKAQDVRTVAAAVLANTEWALEDRELHYEYTNVPASPFAVGPPNTFSGNIWTDSIVTFVVPGAKAGDDLLIRAWGNWQLNSTSSAGDVVGKARIEVVEDPGGGGPLGVFDLVGNAVLTDDSGALALPHNEEYTLIARHRVVGDSDALVKIQVRSEDLTGGAGIATIVLMFSARLDITHVRRSNP